MGQIAEAFHVLPSVAARDLDDDPERLSLAVMPLLAYSRAYHALDAAQGADGAAALKAWDGSKMMEYAKRNKIALMKSRAERWRAERLRKG